MKCGRRSKRARVAGSGYDITGVEIAEIYRSALQAVERLGMPARAEQEIPEVVDLILPCAVERRAGMGIALKLPAR